MRTIIILSILILFSFQEPAKVKILMAGDSTMAFKPEKAYPEIGWGMALEDLITSNAEIRNHAVNGRSSKSFISEGRWDSLCSQISKGDYVIIQFGHNDQKIKDSTRFTIPQTTYKENLLKMVTDVRKKDAYPILCTSIIRRHFNADGKLKDTHGNYTKVMLEVAKELRVDIIDLQKLTEDTFNNIGPEKSKSMFMFVAMGEFPNITKARMDSTHLRMDGARIVAGLFAKEVKKQNLPLTKYLK